MWQWFYKLGSPRHFYEMTTGFVPWLARATFLLLAIGLVWGLGFAPPDYQMGDNYRIIYIHVPTASGAIWIYAMMAVMAAMHMIWNIKVADMVAKSCALIGASFCAVALVTGAFWGKPTWGTYWIWDAKLTATLILFFIYVGVMALRSAFDSETAASKAASVLTRAMGAGIGTAGDWQCLNSALTALPIFSRWVVMASMCGCRTDSLP